MEAHFILIACLQSREQTPKTNNITFGKLRLFMAFLEFCLFGDIRHKKTPLHVCYDQVIT